MGVESGAKKIWCWSPHSYGSVPPLDMRLAPLFSRPGTRSEAHNHRSSASFNRPADSTLPVDVSHHGAVDGSRHQHMPGLYQGVEVLENNTGCSSRSFMATDLPPLSSRCSSPLQLDELVNLHPRGCHMNSRGFDEGDCTAHPSLLGPALQTDAFLKYGF